MFAHASLWFRQCSKIRFRDGVRVTLKLCFLSGCLSSRSASLEHKKQNVSHQNGSILDLDFFGLEVVTSLHCSEISLCLWKLYGNLFQLRIITSFAKFNQCPFSPTLVGRISAMHPFKQIKQFSFLNYASFLFSSIGNFRCLFACQYVILDLLIYKNTKNPLLV